MTTADGPAVSPEMLIIAAMLEEVRKAKGAAWCQRRGLCAIRRRVAMPDLTAASGLNAEALAKYIEAHRLAQAALAAFCGTCAGCPANK